MSDRFVCAGSRRRVLSLHVRPSVGRARESLDEAAASTQGSWLTDTPTLWGRAASGPSFSPATAILVSANEGWSNM
jgi:hypothetical protein